MIGVVLEKREAIEQMPAAFMNKEGGLDVVGGVAEAQLDFGPPLGPVGIGGLDAEAEFGEMFRDGAAIELGAEEVATGGNLAEATGFLGLEIIVSARAGGAGKNVVALAH